MILTAFNITTFELAHYIMDFTIYKLDKKKGWCGKHISSESLEHYANEKGYSDIGS